MGFRIITVVFDIKKEMFMDDELRKFLMNKKIRNYCSKFFIYKEKPYWSIFIEYDEIETPVLVEKNELNEKEKHIFEKLRLWRNEKAYEMGTPPYIVFTNKQLIKMAKRIPQTYEAMKSIDGIGEKKIKNYGKGVLDILKAFEKIDER